MNSLSNPEAAAIKRFLQIYPEIIPNPNEDAFVARRVEKG